MGDWYDLCEDILKLIVDKFSEIEDIVRFGAVCRSWQSVSVLKKQFCMMSPMLMLVEKEESDRRGFYCLSTQKVYHMNLPEARGRRCWSSYGWLITFGIDLEIHLFNPFSRAQIRLPPQPTLPHQYPTELKYTEEELRQIFIKRVVLSSTPSSLSVKTTPCKGDDDGKLMVMVISSQFKKLAFLRLGDEVWTAIECPIGFSDSIYFNGQFYAVNSKGILFICDISSPQPKTIEFSGQQEEEIALQVGGYFLFESLAELFMVAVEYVLADPEDDDSNSDEDAFIYRNQTVGFDVYKFNFDSKKWTLVKSLDNRALFVGNNNAFAIFPSDQHPGCEPNCIYFTETWHDNLIEGAGHDMGVYEMETQEFKSHYVGPDFFSHFCTPLWICPYM